MKTTKTLCMLIFALCMANESKSQTVRLKAGLNLSNLITNDDMKFVEESQLKSLPGFRLGSTVDFKINKLLSLETGLLLSTKGWKESYSEWEGDDKFELDFKVRLSYLEIPLTLKATKQVKNVKLYGFIGPYAAFGLLGRMQLKAKYTIDGESESDSDSEPLEFGDDLKIFDFGWTSGIGMEYNKFQFDLSYTRGLSNIISEEPMNSNDKMNLGVVNLTFGYKIFEKN